MHPDPEHEFFRRHVALHVAQTEIRGEVPQRRVLALLEQLNRDSVGRPDERWGEVPVAYVVVRAAATTTPEELVEHCRTQLARFKVPKEVVLVDELPRNPSGKVLKRELRTRTAS